MFGTMTGKKSHRPPGMPIPAGSGGRGRKSRRQDTEPRLEFSSLRPYIRGMAKRLSFPATQAAVGYVRVSLEKQAADGSSPSVQRTRIADFCTVHRLDLVEVHEDTVSGARDERQRPGLAAALDAIAAGRASVLVVPDVDRLARDADLIGFLRVTVARSGGKVLVIADEGESDEVRLIRQLLAQFERNRIRARMKVWSAARKAKGLPMGYAPFGYRKGMDGRLEPVEDEAPTLARILSHRSKGASLQAIANALNADAIPTRSGKPWNVQTISNILKRARSTEGRGGR